MLTKGRLDQHLYRLCSILAIVGTPPNRELLAIAGPFGYVHPNVTNIGEQDRRKIRKEGSLYWDTGNQRVES